MTRCSVPSCTNDANHHFPKDAQLRKCWLKAIRRTDFVPKNGARICRKHFHDSDFVKVSNYTGLVLQNNFLKKNAVPSIFPWSDHSTSDSSCILAKERRRRIHRMKRHYHRMGSSRRFEREHNRHHGVRANNGIRIESRGGKISLPAARHLNINIVTRGTQTLSNLRLFCTPQLLSDDETIRFYTGLDNYAQFSLILSTLMPMAKDIKYQSETAANLSVEDQFLVVLIKLRRSKPDFEIAKMFGVTKVDVSFVIITWVSFVSDIWSLLDLWPDEELVKTHMPMVFRENGMLNGIEGVGPLKNRGDVQKLSFSQYRVKDTVKFLVGCTPTGVITHNFDAIDVTASLIDTRIHKPESRNPGDSMNLDRDLANTVPIERLMESIKTFTILANALNRTYVFLSKKMFSICLMFCKFKEGMVSK